MYDIPVDHSVERLHDDMSVLRNAIYLIQGFFMILE